MTLMEAIDTLDTRGTYDLSGSAWEQVALTLEGYMHWGEAADAWEKACSASAGHKRRDRATQNALRCRSIDNA